MNIGNGEGITALVTALGLGTVVPYLIGRLKNNGERKDKDTDEVRALLTKQNEDLKAILAEREAEIKDLRQLVNQHESKISEQALELASLRQSIQGLAVYIQTVDPDRAGIVSQFIPPTDPTP